MTESRPRLSRAARRDREVSMPPIRVEGGSWMGAEEGSRLKERDWRPSKATRGRPSGGEMMED